MLDIKTILDEMEQTLWPTAAHDIPTGVLFHYTTADGLQKIVESKKIWATYFRYLNDSKEMLLGESIVQEVAESLRDSWPSTRVGSDVLARFAIAHQKASLTKVSKPFIASFSEHGDLLSQWRAYAANGAGYSFGVTTFKLPEVPRADADGALTLIKCTYDSDEFREYVRNALARTVQGAEGYIIDHGKTKETFDALFKKALLSLLLHAVTVIPRLKHSSFREEAEWRLVVVPNPKRAHNLVKYRATERGIVPYVPIELADESSPLPLKQVFVGPLQHAEVGVETARDWLNQLGYRPAISASDSPYRG